MKKFISLFAVCALVLSAAACGGNTAPAEQTTTAPQTSAADTAAPETSAVTEKVIPEDTPYVIENGITDRMKALANLIDGNKARLAKVFKKAQAGEPITVAYLGGSITQGSTAGPTTCYAYLTTEWLKEQFPKSDITYVNAGIGATGSYIGVFRTDRDVLSKSPDLVFVDFSVNDTTEHTERNIASYDGVLRKLWAAESKPAIVTIAMTQDNGTSFQEYHSAVCEAYDIPMISYHDAILDVIDKGHIKWKDISDDNIHPNTVGHTVLTQIVTSYLEKVLSELDSIDTEHESDFSVPYATDKYATASLIVPGDPQVTNETGWDNMANENFGNFGGYWRAQSKDGTFEGVEPLTFEVDAKSVGIFYGKRVSKGGRFDVLVNGVVVNTIDTAFRGGWGDYVEAEEIIEFKEAGMNKIEIVPHRGEEKSVITISALAVTK
ncbi:MAG: SGNH/GDSL hydrolase family protein [Ruminiclostridium sp.]|nr:SGNH/GDSL hydrolase family protein [Ruminiclostridium sp.]